MVKFSADTVFTDTSELDKLLFQQAQQRIAEEINEFIEQFETKNDLMTVDLLAKTYSQLTTCETKLSNATKQADDNHLSSTVTIKTVASKTQQVQDILQNLLQTVEACQNQKRNSPFYKEKEAYLKKKEERRKQLEKEIRKESDKLEEFYAKKTRESIYNNIVGIHQ
ncbi:uncharacterized protein BX663DRAFT_512314 [Cokeromyces recurvatus]|uniref:uncharacterized protein n=1 Tax=Cokeromyces recurvatus TaxID=90255 RepID=UPI00221F6DD2|nr:uncharacterized protein BX663DRAFT_512314 [Cokeromyces recurvatus]KAI7902269.1 hypothetical protein BX663DRAFT_512314 [Cokeromyces recurvatus]